MPDDRGRFAAGISANGFAEAVLAPAGVHTLYGAQVPGLRVIPAEPAVAGVLARAHRAVHCRPAGAVTEEGIVDIPGLRGGEPETVELSGPSDVAVVAATLPAALRNGGVRIRISTDLGRLGPRGAAGPVEDPWQSGPEETAERIDHAGKILILAGPGVVATGAVPGLHALANALGTGVINTWGAKGVFHWRSPHHFATVGLQADDLALAGFFEADLVVATGVDDREVPDRKWRRCPHVEVEPEQLDPLAEQVAKRPAALAMPPLRARLAAATELGWQRRVAPLAPSLVTLQYGQNLIGGGLIAADAGTAGFWVARTFPTTQLGMVAVPSDRVPGWAVACVTVARMAAPLRPALAVLDGAIDETTSAVLDFGRRLGIEIGVEVWGPDGDPLDADSHDRRLAELASATGSLRVGSLATDPSQLDRFVEVAGAVTAW